MKRVFAWMLLVSLFVGCLTGCDMAEDFPLSTISPNETGAEQTQPQEQVKPPAASVELNETVLFEEAGIKVTATGMEEGFFGTEIKFLVENATDRNIVFSEDLVVINGVTLPGFVYIEVAAGKKSNGSLTMYESDLEAVGITEIGTITCYDGRIIDSDSYDLLHDVPYVLQTTAADSAVADIPEEGDVIFDEKGITVKAQVVSDEFYGSSVHLLVENNTDNHIIVQAENISVNGFTVNAWLYDTVYGGTVRICELDLFSTELEENGILEIEEITFTLEFLNEATYNSLAHSEELQIFVAK